MDPDDAVKIIKGLEFINSIRGSYLLNALESESSARLNARRSLVARVDIKAGDIIREDMLTFKRPGNGISPSEIHKIIGTQAIIDILEDSVLDYSMLVKIQ